MNDAKIADLLKSEVGKSIKTDSIFWHMMTIDEIKALYDFALANKDKDYNTIVMVQENSVASIIKAAVANEFFEESKEKDHTISKFPECAKDITDYGCW